MKYWYEVFIDMGDSGTRTIESFDLLADAQAYYNKQGDGMHRMDGVLYPMHIDRWALINGTPEPIEEVRHG